MRANQNEINYKNLTLQIGNGEYPTVDQYREIIRLPDQMVMPENESMFVRVYGERIQQNDRSVYNRCILTPKNETRFVTKSIELINSVLINFIFVKRIKINEEAISRFGDDSVIQHDLFSVDQIIRENHDDEEDFNEFAPIEFIHNLNPSGMPPHKLSLKLGCQVMLLRNLCIDLGAVNGKRLIVRHIGKKLIKFFIQKLLYLKRSLFRAIFYRL